jgi:hypothetical protein
METAGDWRSSESTDYFEKLDLEQLAFEFLSRDPRFRKEHAALDRQIKSGRIGAVGAIDALRKTWGLSFRKERSLQASFLGASSFTHSSIGWTGTPKLRRPTQASHWKPT